MSRQTRSSGRPPKLIAKSSRVQRRSTGISYKEPDTDEEDHPDDFIEESTTSKTRNRPRRRRYPARQMPYKLTKPIPAPPARKPRRRPRSRSISASSTFSESQTDSQLSAASTQSSTTCTETPAQGDSELNSPIIPWSTLEYAILENIFHYGAKMTQKDCRSDPVDWLIGAAKTCRALSGPASGALYKNTYLYGIESVRGFMSATKTDDGSANIHGKMVQHLQIESYPALTRKEKNQTAIHIEAILATTLNIKSLAIDMFGVGLDSKRKTINAGSKGPRIIYRPEMIEVMDRNNTFLKSMKWNYFLNMNQSWPWREMQEVHGSRPCSALENLDIVWLNYFTANKHKKAQIQSLVESLDQLTRLKSISFCYSSLFHEDVSLLDSLPRHLESIEFEDCEDLDSDTLAKFLVTHGHNLRRLTLKHNRSLNLGFMGVLGSACPSLEVLEMDLQYYSLTLSTADAEPTFTELLPSGITPTWPSKLQKIHMVYLRKWERNAATIFLESLVNSAADLPELRSLTIKTTVDLEWRDRISFRDEWYARLERVFQRPFVPPSEKYNTLPKMIMKQEISSDNTTMSTTNGSRKRKSRDDDEEQNEESIARRLRRRKSNESTEARNTPVPVLPEAAPISDADTNIYLQKMCTTVDIRIENLRPAETQYQEQDFLDEEVSGDEDWDGQDHWDSRVGGTYVWAVQ